MGINVLNNTSSQEIIAPAGANLTAGDLIINTESGNAFAASNALTIAQNNNTTAGPSALVANTTSGTDAYSGYYQSSSRQSICQLSNGTLVMTYPGNKTNSQFTNVNIVFKTLLNGGIIAPISISASNVYWTQVRPLSSSFVVMWADGSNNLKFAIYNNDGTTVLADTTVAASVYVPSTSDAFDINITTNNEIVIAYSITPTGGMKFKRFNSSGVLQGSETIVEASVEARCVKVLPDLSGGFLIYYKRQTATASYKYARYNSSGTIQGSLTVLTTQTGSFLNGNIDNLGLRLSGNGFVLIGPGQSTNYPSAYVFNSSATLLKTINIGGASAAYAAANTLPGICRTGTGFSLFYRGSATAGNLSTYDFSGAELLGRTATSYTGWGDLGTQYCLNLIDLGNAGFCVFNVSMNSTNLLYVTILCINSNAQTVGSAVVIYNGAGNTGGFSASILTSDGSLFYNEYDSGGSLQINYGMYAIQRKSVVGVAQNTVAANSNVRIATTGSYTINSNFFAGGNFDQRTATVPGTKGTVVGSSAVLFGMS